jgi:hypothetical protein
VAECLEQQQPHLRPELAIELPRKSVGARSRVEIGSRERVL